MQDILGHVFNIEINNQAKLGYKRLDDVFNSKSPTDDHFNYRLVCRMWYNAIATSARARLATYNDYDDVLMLMCLNNDSFALYQSKIPITTCTSNSLRYTAPLTMKLLENTCIHGSIPYQIAQ